MRIEGQRILLADYLNNFSRDRANQTRDNNVNKSKLTLEDFQAIRKRKPKAFFVKNSLPDDY
jgi:hypothetical protein